MKVHKGLEHLALACILDFADAEPELPAAVGQGPLGTVSDVGAGLCVYLVVENFWKFFLIPC